eukprot:scaffold210888_cov18-Tisochrysis_lutea.AAC.2
MGRPVVCSKEVVCQVWMRRADECCWWRTASSAYWSVHWICPGYAKIGVPAADAQGCRVLLVEDNPINQTVARKMLSGMKLHCE